MFKNHRISFAATFLFALTTLAFAALLAACSTPSATVTSSPTENLTYLKEKIVALAARFSPECESKVISENCS
jgi:uncharacterized lipoprotein YajG